MMPVILITAAWAQDQKPEFIWSNLEQKYQSFETLKPVIELRNVEFVIFDRYADSPEFVLEADSLP